MVVVTVETTTQESMVNLEQTFDSVKTVAAAGWKSPLTRPDLHPVQEVLLLKDHFSELLRTESVAIESEGFRNMLRESESAAADLEAAHRRGQLLREFQRGPGRRHVQRDNDGIAIHLATD